MISEREKEGAIDHSLVSIDTGQAKPYMLDFSTQEVPMRGLPQALYGATVVHLSDLHAGFGGTDPVYEEVICRVNALSPDVIVFTGDYIDDNSPIKNYPMPALLRRFQARLGIFGSFGNHDHRRGIIGSRRVLDEAGLHILNNESFELAEGLWLAGVDDLHEGKPDIARAFSGVPNDRTTLVLSHNPRLIEHIPERDALILSGHTHGGQIALPFVTPKLVCLFHLHCRQVAGWYANGKARLYVNRGVGVTGKPYRYKCPAEVAILRLVPQIA